MNKILFIGIGGFLGSTSRYLIYLLMNKFYNEPFPLSTFTVNIVGSFVLGALYAYGLKNNFVSAEIMLLFTVGFCGSFTTFSTFSMESLNLIKDGLISTFLLYAVLSVLFGILSAWAGYQLFR